jgi:CRISPR/Cas system-associated exonuclease Cas4 (RecB family)
MVRIVTFILFISTGIVHSQAKYTPKNYVDLYKDIAITEMEKYGIPASIKLGQGILESSAGNSILAKTANNHFGIKCKKEWTGETFYQDDDEKNECFRKYKDVLASYEDHSKFLKNGARYASLFELSKDDYKGWAKGLKAAGYATNPQYAQLLIKTIEENELYVYDKLNTKPAIIKKETKVITKSNKNKSDKSEFSDFEISKKTGRKIELNNNVKFVLAKKGDSYLTLTQELDLMHWQLKKYNDLEENHEFREGEIVYIQPKRRKAVQESYRLGENENLKDVSQKFAIKLNRLYILNNLEKGAISAPGTILKLR